MKWFRYTSAVIATLGLTTAANAGLLDLFKSHGSSKSCGCAPCYQPQCCKPTITKPCCPNVYTYQRRLSDIKPPCCDRCCAPKSCCQPVGKCCVTPNACGPQCPATCAAPAAAPAACAPAAAPACAAPAACAPAAAPANCAPTCAAPANCAPACAAPTNCAPTCAAPVNCAPACAPKGACCAKQNCCPQQGCCGKNRCCNVDHCKLAKLIYKSQTACYAKDRRAAIHYIGDHFDCVCSPEIMTAFIYALNDADERVRAKAADEIGDQIRKNRCCCSKEVIAALTAALGDCDRSVRREAKQALQLCGYDVVKGCCQCVSCDPCSCNYGGPRPWMKGGIAPTPAGKDQKVAPPAPGTQKVYYPANLRYSQPSKSRARLSNLFGLIN